MVTSAEKLLLKRLNNIGKEYKINIPLIEYTINFIKNHHGLQRRHSGEPFYNHPIEVAYMITDFYIDNDTIIAALLHDVVEDTRVSLKQIEFIFGKKVSQLVDSVTKITVNYQLSKRETISKINENCQIKKESITIKVIDRLHNMRTLKYIKSLEKQKRIAQETLEIYVPLAEKVSLNNVKQELEALANRILSL
jgi:GTP pyrophosphokinase